MSLSISYCEESLATNTNVNVTIPVNVNCERVTSPVNKLKVVNPNLIQLSLRYRLKMKRY